MAERPFPRVTVTPKGEKSLRGGHPWVYAGEVIACDGCESGRVADVYSRSGKWLGAGFYNEASLIRVRLLSRNPNDRMDADFFRRRLRWAVAYRRRVMGEGFSSCRLVFGEADALPGLTVDRYENVLVTQIASLGMERIRDLLYEGLLDALRDEGVRIDTLYQRNELALREKEGLPLEKGYYLDRGLQEGSGSVQITENGVRYQVDYVDGQKTGFFLDQRLNRRAIQELASGMHVLDCFTHTGAFALNAAMGGAQMVTAVDVSAAALEQAEKNALLNGLNDRIQWKKGDVFDLLSGPEKPRKGSYDLIILDPPAFTKSSSTVRSASAGYKEINLRAMLLLNRGGYLATCSCSHFMPESLFRRMAAEAAADANVQLREVFHGRQAPDHPILWGVPETDYLKFYLFQVV